MASISIATNTDTNPNKDRQAAPIAIVEQDVRLENEHDLEGILRTFGETARYDDEAWAEHYEGSSVVPAVECPLLAKEARSRAPQAVELSANGRFLSELAPARGRSFFPCVPGSEHLLL